MKVRLVIAKNWKDGRTVALIAPNDCYSATAGNVVDYLGEDGELMTADVIISKDYLETDGKEIAGAARINPNCEIYRVLNTYYRNKVEWPEEKNDEDVPTAEG